MITLITIYKDILDENYSTKILNEAFNMDSKIYHAADYVMNSKEHYRYVWLAVSEYMKTRDGQAIVHQRPISEIKTKLLQYFRGLEREVRNIGKIDVFNVHGSKKEGFSNYVKFSVRKPTSPKHKEFIASHTYLYEIKTIRISEHTHDADLKYDADRLIPFTENNDYDDEDYFAKIDCYGKSFNDVKSEVIETIRNHVEDVSRQERLALNNRNKSKTESKMRLRINERLELIANGIYATDSATDVANWLVNKPKAYRILYDAKRDVWGVADAMRGTHMDIARNLYKSGYIFLSDKEIETMKRDLGDSARYMSAQDLYAKYGFYGDSTMYGLFFIPKQEDYLDYEEQGFYNVETVLTTGSIFARRKGYFSSEGPLSSLYNKLKVMGAIEEGQRKPLEKIYADCKSLYPNDTMYMFKNIANENGYSGDEVNAFIRSLPEYSLTAMFEKYFKTYGIKRAADFLRTKAKQIGYSKKEIEDFLSDMFDD